MWGMGGQDGGLGCWEQPWLQMQAGLLTNDWAGVKLRPSLGEQGGPAGSFKLWTLTVGTRLGAELPKFPACNVLVPQQDCRSEKIMQT